MFTVKCIFHVQKPEVEVIYLEPVNVELPTEFPFPAKYDPRVEAALKSGEIDCFLTSKFVTAISQVMFQYKTHPRPSDYDSVAKQCVKKYPFLSNELSVWVSLTIAFTYTFMLPLL